MNKKMLGKYGAPDVSARAKGGDARAKALSQSRRSEIAKSGALARWSGEIRTATHGDEAHPLKVGEITIPCYVLDDGTRVFSQRGIFDVFQLRSGGHAMQRFVSGGDLTKTLDEKSVDALENPVKFHLPRGGRTVYGYPVSLLVDVCNAVLSSRDAGTLPDRHSLAAMRADIFVRAIAKVGIIALVDEVTGYQEIRHKEALQALLDRYMRQELAAWAKRFPDAFYREIFRLRKWDWKGAGNSNSAVAHYTKDLIYSRLSPELLAELEAKNPRIDNKRKSKHHQWLNDEIGIPALTQHIHAVTAIMRTADTWDAFMGMLNRAFPQKEESLLMPLLEWRQPA